MAEPSLILDIYNKKEKVLPYKHLVDSLYKLKSNK